ncbi:DIEXF family protein [Megaselia abdita]
MLLQIAFFTETFLLDKDHQEVQSSEEEEEAQTSKDEADQEENNKSSKLTDKTDPFAIHLDNMLAQTHIDNLLKKPIECKTSKMSTKKLGNLLIEIPKSFNITESKKSKALLDDEEVFASEGTEPKFFKKSELENFQIKPKILPNVNFNQLQSEMFSVVNNYQDLFYSQRSLENAEEVRSVYCLHVLNHIIKTRQKILHHNGKLTAASAAEKNSTAIVPDSYRDQGLVRPRILIIVPFRDSVFRIVNILSNLLYGTVSDITKNVLNYKRFQEEYTGDTIYFRKTNPKPEDYQKTFSGNTDDTFRIGISFTKKTMKLYTEFYSSDILIASPLGLRMIVGASGDAERDYDFLSSLEVLVLDQTELFFAQNWDHLLHVFDHMHLQPQQTRNTDFSRVRPWCLNGFSKFYRQTLMFASHELPEFRSLFNKCSNYRGKVRQLNPVAIGTIRNVFVQTPQVFHKVDVSSLDTMFDQRFNYFINEILPQFKGPSKAHCMIYIPSYFDYVRIRNYFKAENMNFVQICEYTKDAKFARARDMFFHSAAHFLLYSERGHFFKRTKIKGIRHIIMYAPPNYPHLYSELLNFMEDSNQNSRDGLEGSMSVTVLYTKYDMLQVSLVLGTDSAGNMLKSGRTESMFMTEK